MSDVPVENRVHFEDRLVKKGEAYPVRRPEDEAAEQGTYIVLAHGCPPSRWNIVNFDPEDGAVATLDWAIQEHKKLISAENIGLDRVLFPVGLVGRTFPKGAAFWVPGECMACDKHFERPFIWRNDTKHFLMSRALRAR